MTQDPNVSRLIEKRIETLNKQISILQIELDGVKKQLNISTISGSLFSQAKESFSKLTNGERKDILNDYCTYCGANEKEFGKCYCAPCYDI